MVGGNIHVYLDSFEETDVVFACGGQRSLPAGRHSFQFGCNQEVGDIYFNWAEISAVVIGSG